MVQSRKPRAQRPHTGLAATCGARTKPIEQLMKEQGIANIDIESWIGFVGPAGMDPQVVAKLSDAIGQVVKTPKLREDFRLGGAEARWLGPQEFAVAVRESYELWARTLANVGFRKE